MTPDRLLAHYHRIADAPDAIPRLRRFVQDLAVRGKLVAQVVGDEPAPTLLRRIAAERAQRVKSGELRAAKAAAGVRIDNPPFTLPGSWTWTHVSQIGIISPRNDPGDDTIEASFVPMTLIPAELGSPHGHEVRIWGEIKKGYTHFKEGDVGLAKITPCFENGKSTVFRNLTGGLGSGTTELHVVRPILVAPDYILIFLKSPQFIETGIPRMTGTAGQKRVPSEYFALSPFPLPPLAEQHRIVAKVDELMALCDRLEAGRAAREAARDRMAAATLARLNTPDLDPATFTPHARFALNALPALTTRPDQIKPLRQTILNLAVRGKLVPQGASDDYVSQAPHRTGQMPLELPASWQYQPLGSLLREDTRNGYSRRPDEAADGVPILRISAGTVRRDGLVAEEEHKLISGIDERTRREYGLEVGDLLACRFNGNKAFVGRLTMFTGYLGLRPIYPDKLIRVRANPDVVLPEFLRTAGESDLVRAEIEAHCATTVGNWGISASNLKEVRFPLPPLAEQQHIVAKVDALMALCDRLETALATGDDTRRRLLDALLQEALAAPGTGLDTAA
jgi:type I restriction enzyme S subunit